MGKHRKIKKAEQHMSLELNALLDEDDSDCGQRLAEYLLKKRGTARPQRVFAEFKPKRLSSLQIRLKKVNSPGKEENNQENNEKQKEVQNEKEDIGTEKPTTSRESRLKLQKENSQANIECDVDLTNNAAQSKPKETSVDGKLQKSPSTVPNSAKPASIFSPSQRFSIRKSGGMPSADRLRRYSLRRLSATSGRRTLLNEFENASKDSDFLPNYCSTPMGPTSPKTPTKKAGTKENSNNDKTLSNSVEENSKISSPLVIQNIYSGSEDVARLMSSLQKRDKSLQELLNKVQDATIQSLQEKENLSRVLTTPPRDENKSPSNSSMRRRTYTIEKGTEAGQVILTPVKTATSTTVVSPSTPKRPRRQDENTDEYPLPVSPVENAVFELHSANVTPKKQVPDKSSLLASPKVMQILQRITGKSPQQTLTSRTTKNSRIQSSRIPLPTPSNNVIPLSEIQRTPTVVAEQHQVNTTVDCELEIPETQEHLSKTTVVPPTTTELLNSLQGAKTPMVLVPIYQTFNQLPQTVSNLEVVAEETTASNAKQTVVEKLLRETEVTLNKIKNIQMDESIKVLNKVVDTGVNTTKNTINTTTDKTLHQTTNKTSKQSSIRKHVGTPIKTTTDNPALAYLANYIEIDDDIRFEDIITDDEDESPRSQPHPVKTRMRLRNISQKTHFGSGNSPLNLAPPAVETRGARRLRQRSARRQLITNESSENETKLWPPRAHALTVSRPRNREKQTRTNVPLNAEPRTPINGEKFASELKMNLARLRNHEILDLRKRNSLGKVFIASGSKSAEKMLQLEKQMQLEEEIELEILRRTLLGNDDGLTAIAEAETDENQDFEGMFELPPAPDGFRDPTIIHMNSDLTQQQQHAEQQQEVEQMCVQEELIEQLENDQQQTEEADKEDSLKCVPPLESSLIDERSCDRISFIPPTRRRSSTIHESKKGKQRSRKRKENEEVRKYLDVSKNLVKHNPGDKSKRSLYCGTEDENCIQAPQHISENENIVSDVPSLNLRIETPSPVLSQESLRKSRSSNSIEIQPLAPPQGFSNCDSNEIVENNNNIFKKPLPPPPITQPKQKKAQKKSNKTNNKKPVLIEEMSGLELISGTTTDQTDDSVIFKKPELPVKGRKKSIKNKPETQMEEKEEALQETPENDSSGLRRSKRGHMPLKNYWSFRSTDIMPLYDIAILQKRKEEARMQREMRRNNTAMSVQSTGTEYVPVGTSTTTKAQNPQTKRNKPKKNQAQAQVNLGDTDVTSVSSVSSTFSSSKLISSSRLPVISEQEHIVAKSTTEQTRSSQKTHRKSKAIEANVNLNHLTAISEREEHNELPQTSAASARRTTDTSQRTLIPDHVEKLNNMFDQLKNASTVNANASTLNAQIEQSPKSSSSSQSQEGNGKKNLCVRLKRVKLKDQQQQTAKSSKASNKTNSQKKKTLSLNKNSSSPVDKSIKRTSAGKLDNVASVTEPQQESVEGPLLSWLQNISSGNNKPGEKKLTNVFHELRCSKNGNLVLSTLEGLEFAYYDNDPDGTVSYLRFNPHQIKPSKRARKFHLKFLVLSGKFAFSTNRDLATFTDGELITIDIGARYSIKNITDKQAILMVLKTAKS